MGIPRAGRVRNENILLDPDDFGRMCGVNEALICKLMTTDVKLPSLIAEAALHPGLSSDSKGARIQSTSNLLYNLSTHLFESTIQFCDF